MLNCILFRNTKYQHKDSQRMRAYETRWQSAINSKCHNNFVYGNFCVAWHVFDCFFGSSKNEFDWTEIMENEISSKRISLVLFFFSLSFLLHFLYDISVSFPTPKIQFIHFQFDRKFAKCKIQFPRNKCNLHLFTGVSDNNCKQKNIKSFFPFSFSKATRTIP